MSFKKDDMFNVGEDNKGFEMTECVVRQENKHTGKQDKQCTSGIVLSNAGNTQKDSEIGDEREEKTGTDVKHLIYSVNDSLPLHLTFLFAIQQCLLALSQILSVTVLVAHVVCADDNEEVKNKLLSSSLFTTGFTTLFMNTFGIRLPLIQGAIADFVIPILAMGEIKEGLCNSTQSFNVTDKSANQTWPTTLDDSAMSYHAIQTLQGSLMAAGGFEFFVGVTGLVGVLLPFIGPVTIVPAMLLGAIYMSQVITDKFAYANWGITLTTFAVAIILSLYLRKMKTPIPVWTRQKSCHVIHYPLHQVFAVLIAIVVGWIICGFLTFMGYFGSDIHGPDYYSRTDSMTDIIERANWFYFPYPGQFGLIRFDSTIFAGFVIATLLSILDSIGDYHACASMCHVPNPPAHGVNRGIAVEGLCGIISGSLGCGHATSTYGGNIGAIGLTKVASRSVFIAVAIIFLVFGIFGKLSSVFLIIPYPVLGGALTVLFGAFIGVVLKNLQFLDISSSRNVTIIGCSLLVGLMIPYWVKTHGTTIRTGYKDMDDVISMLIGNPNLIGTLLACFLDNTVPGSKEERGIAAWQPNKGKIKGNKNYTIGYEFYQPVFFHRYSSSRILKFLPFMPNPKSESSVDCPREKK